MDVHATVERISFDPRVMCGRACIRGTVATILGLIADGVSVDEILADYPYFAQEDVDAALLWTRIRGDNGAPDPN